VSELDLLRAPPTAAGSLSAPGDRLQLARTDASKKQLYYTFGDVRYTQTPATTRGFTGQRRDGSGLMFYQSRYYDPLIGRFTQPDTIIPNPSNPQDFNRYSYVLNNPILYSDPTGHCGHGRDDWCHEVEVYTIYSGADQVSITTNGSVKYSVNGGPFLEPSELGDLTDTVVKAIWGGIRPWWPERLQSTTRRRTEPSPQPRPHDLPLLRNRSRTASRLSSSWGNCGKGDAWCGPQDCHKHGWSTR